MRKIFLAFCAVAAIYMVSCKSGDKPSDKELKKEIAQDPYLNVSNKQFIVNVPTGWRRTDTTIYDTKVTLLFAPINEGSKFRTTINIINEDMHGIALNDYTGESLHTMQNGMTGFQLIGQGDFQTNSNVAGKWTRYSHENSQGLQSENIGYIIPIGGIAYILTGTTKAREMDKYKNDFDNIAKSFHLK